MKLKSIEFSVKLVTYFIVITSNNVFLRVILNLMSKHTINKIKVGDTSYFSMLLFYFSVDKVIHNLGILEGLNFKIGE